MNNCINDKIDYVIYKSTKIATTNHGIYTATWDATNDATWNAIEIATWDVILNATWEAIYEFTIKI